MLIVQPENSFSDYLCSELDGVDRQQWQAFEFAVAWVNQAGINKVFDSIERFLSRNNRVRATLGLDFSSTSYEGLSRFLDLENRSLDIETYVFHDENRSCTFHPKAFLFKNSSEARLLVGSNNMTGAGVSTNIEIAMAVTRQLDDMDIQKIGRTLEGWRNEKSENRVRRLSQVFLERLLKTGYVRTEDEIRRERIEGDVAPPREPLFGKSNTPSRKRSRTSFEVPDDSERAFPANELIMRVRPRRNGTQFQISMRIYPLFFKGATDVVSAVSRQRQKIGISKRNSSRGRIPNTARFEAPELNGLQNPIAVFKWVGEAPEELVYQIYDANDNSEGTRFFNRLREGIAATPVTRLESLSRDYTVLSKSDRESAQWYRLS
ncbi:phospholipase D family protein [Pseudomonas sp. AFG_SD02_1510_Pfu_092]|uniref:phospholipase D family protein n=1 Tax=Pseudomonas sp. AFG_SD02_1510_Pfu_092 TaxID=2259497 RepID=UPI000DEF5864|nr:phospholipase D family protein [Pseudomonas sp. AFG_SD02_1510_Pfu_092]